MTLEEEEELREGGEFGDGCTCVNCRAADRIRELESERDSLQEDVIEVTTRMATAEAIIHAIDFRLGRDGWTLELAQALGYSQSDRGDKQ
jgi:hypothetical protein